jgi:hypothetical protein
MIECVGLHVGKDPRFIYLRTPDLFIYLFKDTRFIYGPQIYSFKDPRFNYLRTPDLFIYLYVTQKCRKPTLFHELHSFVYFDKFLLTFVISLHYQYP